MDDVCEGKDLSFSQQEQKVLQWWTHEVKAFETQLEKTKHLPEYIFYDGPKFAIGPHPSWHDQRHYYTVRDHAVVFKGGKEGDRPGPPKTYGLKILLQKIK